MQYVQRIFQTKLTQNQLVKLVSISEEAWEKIEKSRAVIEDMLDRGQTIYG